VRLLVDAVDLDSTIGADQKTDVKIEKLRELRDTVLFLNLIRIELDNDEDAYLIFETLNTRGKDLELTDLLKNHFPKSIRSKSSVNLPKEQWSRLLTTLSKSNVDIDPDTFFTHSWSSRFEPTTQQKAYKKIKSKIKVKKCQGTVKGLRRRC
jgi:uncharacterized protein with ParB-like and HNH nuclease domain